MVGTEQCLRKARAGRRAGAVVLCLVTAGAPGTFATSTLQSLEPPHGTSVVVPQGSWETRTPEQVGLRRSALDALRSTLGGRGAIVRHGYLVYTWGDVSTREDVASAAKPLYAHFLFEAVEDGRLSSVDAQAAQRGATCLTGLNAALAYKDRQITFRHMANQVSCYGVSETPGQAFDYNDYQMALFWDTLFLKVWETTYAAVDGDVLRPYLSSVLLFQDAPTFLAFGANDRPGRLAISPRDFCRFGLLYLRHGDWGGVRILPEERTLDAVTRTLPLDLPRTAAVEADMCAGQRTLGSTSVPDDQYAHDGGYAWGWWVNGRTSTGARRWPSAEVNVHAALGHDGKSGLAVLPCLDLVLSWNDGTPDVMDEVFAKLYEAASAVPLDPPPAVGPVLRLSKGAGGTLRLSWGGDEGAPRAPGEHYHLLRGTRPQELDVAPGTHPRWAARYDEPASWEPLVFYEVLAASACEQVSEN